MTCTATLVRRPEPSPTLYGHHLGPVPAGCVLLRVEELAVGDVLQHDVGTFELVTSIVAFPGRTSRQVHVLRTMPNGRTATCSFWIGEHARRTVHQVASPPHHNPSWRHDRARGAQA